GAGRSSAGGGSVARQDLGALSHRPGADRTPARRRGRRAAPGRAAGRAARARHRAGARRVERGLTMDLIVAATDFSPTASAATRRAAQLAAVSGARVALLHVAPHRASWRFFGNSAVRLSDLHRKAVQLQREYRVPVAAYLAEGSTDREIASFARSKGADLIVLGLRGGFLQDLFGTATAQRVRRRVGVPVLAVAREPARPYRKVLVATDFSAASARAARLVSRILPEAAVRLLHVCDPRTGQAKNALSRLRRFAARTGLVPAAVDVAVGSPAAAIREHAASVGADLVVTAPAETSRLARRIFYGVTDALLSGGKHD